MSRYYKDPNRKANHMQLITVPKHQLSKARSDRYSKALKETGDMFYSMVKSLEITTRPKK